MRGDPGWKWRERVRCWEYGKNFCLPKARVWKPFLRLGYKTEDKWAAGVRAGNDWRRKKFDTLAEAQAWVEKIAEVTRVK